MRRLIFTSPSFGAVISAAPVVLHATVPSSPENGKTRFFFSTGKTPPSNPVDLVGEGDSLKGLQGLTLFSMLTGAFPIAIGDQFSSILVLDPSLSS